MAEDSCEHLAGLVGVGGEAEATVLPEWGPAPQVGIYNQVAEVDPV